MKNVKKRRYPFRATWDTHAKGGGGFPPELRNAISSFLNINNFILIIIIALAVFSRFFKLAQFFTFNFDEEYQASLAWEQVKHLHKIWIGVSASTVNYYLGPGITYLNALLFRIDKDPVILGIFGSAFGIVTLLSLYFVTKRVFNRNAALFAAAFYTGSLFLNFFDRRFWNDTPIIFISLWLFYGLMQLKKDTRWLIFIIFLMGVALHVHLSLLAFWPVIILVIFINRQRIPFSYYLLSVISFVLITFPLLVFDFVHNFDNLLMPVRYVKIFFSSHHDGNFFSGWSQFLNSLSRLWFIRPYSNVQDEIQLGVHGNITPTIIWLSLFSLLILAWIIIQTIRHKEYRILVLSMISFIAVYLYYPGGVVAYFLLGFFGLFAIATGLFFSRLPKLLAISIMIVFIAINMYSLLTLQQEQFGLATRKKLVQDIMPVVGNKSFYLETVTIDKRPYHSAGGWRYIFKAYGRTPAQSNADQFFGWIFPEEISKTKPKMRVIVSEYPTTVKQPVIVQFREGVYYGYVVKNN